MTDAIVGAFALNHPDKVAINLKGHKTTDVIVFLATMEAHLAARVLTRMELQSLSKCLDEMAIERLSELIIQAVHEDALMLITHLSKAKHQALLKSANAEQTQLSARLASYTERSLGAHVNQKYISVNNIDTIEAVRNKLAEVEIKQDQPLYLVDDENRLLGCISMVGLLSSTDHSRLVKEIAIKIKPLNEKLTPEEALKAQQWFDNNQLPVVNAGNQLLGVVKRRQLMNISNSQSTQKYGMGEIATDVTSGYLQTCTHLLDLLILGPKK